MTGRLPRRVGAAALAAALCGAGAACASGPPGSAAATDTAAPPATEVRLTEEQRVTVSRLFQRNFEAKGAKAEVRLPGGGSTMVAELDWELATGHGLIDNAGAPAEIFWSDQELLDGTIPDLTREMAAGGRAGVRFVARPLDPAYSVVDTIASLLLGLASPQRDNPVALQDQDLAYRGQRRLAERTVDVFRFGERTTYFVDPATGAMVGLDVTLATFEGIVEIRLVEVGPREVRGPKSAEVVAGTEIQDLYLRLTGRPLSGTPGSAPVPTP